MLSLTHTSQISRRAQAHALQALTHASVVILYGPLGSGKSTIAQNIAIDLSASIVDLERSGLQDAEHTIEESIADPAGTLIVIDEITRYPELMFDVLRVIDRSPPTKVKFVITASLSHPRLTTLGLRIDNINVVAIHVPFLSVLELEKSPDAESRLWLYGGLPDAYVRKTNAISYNQRRKYIANLLTVSAADHFQRRVPSKLSLMLNAIAILHGTIFSRQHFVRTLDIDYKTVNSYLDVLLDLQVISLLPASFTNTLTDGPRSKSKIYISDTGILHSLLSIDSPRDLLTSGYRTASWEGFVISQLQMAAPVGTQMYFPLKHQASAILDLVIFLPDGAIWAVDISEFHTPSPHRRIKQAVGNIKPTRTLHVYRGAERTILFDTIECQGVRDTCMELSSIPK